MVVENDKLLTVRFNTNLDELQEHLRVTQEMAGLLKGALEKIENFEVKVELVKKGGDED